MQFVDGTPNISERLAGAIRLRIVEGALEPGRRLNAVHLAAELGVSRTPLREAMAQLCAEGALTLMPRRGMFVSPLTMDEATDLYEMRALLETDALARCGAPSAATLRRLADLTARMDTLIAPEALVATDLAWHQALLAACPNRVLLGLIGNVTQRAHRYELAFIRARPNVRRSAAHHAEIVRALAEGQVAHACEALRRNLEQGIGPLREWLTDQEQPAGSPATSTARGLRT